VKVAVGKKKSCTVLYLKIRVVVMPLSSQEVFPIVSALSELQLSPQSEEMVTDKSSTEDEVSHGTWCGLRLILGAPPLRAHGELI